MRISIIVPIYNSEKYLDKCIKSIISQKYSNFELILINDGSTDNSLEICNKYARNDNRIKVINQENKGSIKARKIGISNSSCEYITFVDSDDWLKRNTLKVVNKSIEVNDPDIIVFNMYKVLCKYTFIRKISNNIYFKGNKIYEGNSIKNNIVTAYFHGHPFPANLCGKVYKREFIESSGIFLKKISFLGDDLFYNLEVLLKVNKVVMIDKPLYCYRTGGNTSKYMPNLLSDILEVYKIQKQVIDNHYINSKNKHYNGISVMLLNTFNVALKNIMLSNLSRSEIENIIYKFISCEEVIEAINSEGANNCFKVDYLNSIKNKDVNYLYNIGVNNLKDKSFKNLLINLLN